MFRYFDWTRTRSDGSMQYLIIENYQNELVILLRTMYSDGCMLFVYRPEHAFSSINGE